MSGAKPRELLCINYSVYHRDMINMTFKDKIPSLLVVVLLNIYNSYQAFVVTIQTSESL